MSRTIALLAGWYYPDSVGGTESYIRALASDLRSLGHSVHLGAPAPEARASAYEVDRIPVYRYPLAPSASTEEAQGREPPAHLDVFREWLIAVRPDIVHIHSFTRGCGIWHARVASSLGIPIVTTVHTPHLVCARETLMRWGTVPCDGVYSPARCTACALTSKGLPRAAAWPLALSPARSDAPLLPGRANTLLQFRNILGERRDMALEFLSIAQRVVAVSSWLQEMLAQSGVPREKLRLSRQGIRATATDTKNSRRERSSGPLRLGFIGRFDATKGLHFIVQAIRRSEPSLPVELHVYGVAANPQAAKYLDSVRALAGDDRRIVFHGLVTDANRTEVLESLDMLVVPSNWFETGPLVVLEAFAAGIPVLGSALGGIQERVTHGVDGWLVPPGNVRAWQVALRELAQRFTSGDWSWTMPAVRTSMTVAEEMSGLYEQVLTEMSTHDGGPPLLQPALE